LIAVQTTTKGISSVYTAAAVVVQHTILFAAPTALN